MRRSVALLGLLLILLAIGPAVGAPGNLTVGPQPRGEEEEEEAAEHAAAGAEEREAEPGPAGADQWFVAQRQYPFSTASSHARMTSASGAGTSSCVQSAGSGSGCTETVAVKRQS